MFSGCPRNGPSVTNLAAIASLRRHLAMPGGVMAGCQVAVFYEILNFALGSRVKCGTLFVRMTLLKN
jgi:hypothetical protein